jgi:EmrB/QacA subfamily drug resistance transporter
MIDNKVMPLNAVGFVAFFTIVIGFFMVMLDSTIVNVSLPVMIRYFKTDMSTISWVVNAYNLAFSVLLLTGSRIADQFGRKKVFMIGIFFFTLTSLLSGISTSVDMLIFYRVLQGLAGALIVPVSMPLIIELFPVSKRGMIIGIWGAVAGLASASGPALGGVIGEYLNWQWIFYINIPIGVIALIIIPFVVKESHDPTADRRIDWAGMITMSIAMFSVVLGLIQANDYGWGSPYILMLFVIAFIFFMVFFFIERKSKAPMLPVGLFKNLYFCTTNISLVILGIGSMCGVFFTAFYLTQVKEFSQLKAGLVITAYPMLLIVTSAITGLLSDKMGNRIFAFSGAILNCIAIYCMFGLNADSTLTDIIWRLAFCGGAIGFAFPSIVNASVKATPDDKIGMASAVGNVSRTLGATLGVALLVTTVTHFAEKEVEKARVHASEIIMSDTVLTKDVKDTVMAKLTSAKFSKDSKLPTEKEILEIFETRRDQAVKKTPDIMKPAIKKVYEKQIAEMSTVYKSIKKTFLDHVANAFSVTYKWSGIMLLIGLVFSFFCEPFRRKQQ